MKVVGNFVWKIVTETAKDIFTSGLFPLYVLYEDNSESLINTYEELNNALGNGLSIGIEVGKLEAPPCLEGVVSFLQELEEHKQSDSKIVADILNSGLLEECELELLKYKEQ